MSSDLPPSYHARRDELLARVTRRARLLRRRHHVVRSATATLAAVAVVAVVAPLVGTDREADGPVVVATGGSTTTSPTTAAATDAGTPAGDQPVPGPGPAAADDRPGTTLVTTTTAKPGGGARPDAAPVGPVRTEPAPGSGPAPSASPSVDLATAILAVRDGTFLALAPDGSGERTLFTRPSVASGYWSVAWSPDRRRLAYAAPDGVHVVDVDGGNDRLVQPGAREPRWSPDGEHLVAACTIAAEGRYWNHVCTFRTDGSEVVDRTPSADHAGFPDWSPDGTSLVYRVYGPRNEDAAIEVLDLRDGRRRVVRSAVGERTESGEPAIEVQFAPRWSPDGRRILFSRKPPSYLYYDLWVMNADGSGARPLAETREDDQQGSWSPDGSRIAFTRRAATGDRVELVVSSVEDWSRSQVVSASGRVGPAIDW